MDKQPLYSLETEHAVLSALLRSSIARAELHAIDDDLFYNLSNQRILTAIRKYGDAIDTTTLCRELTDANDRATAIKLYELDVPYSALAGHVEHLRDLRARRKALQRAKEIVSKLHTLAPSDIKQALAQAAAEIGYMIPREEVSAIEQYLALLEARSRGQIRGISSGYSCLDYYIDGFLAGGLYVIAGRPKMGKTIFAINLLDNALRQDKRVLMLSLEMDSNEILDLIFARRMRVNSRLLKRRAAELTDQQWADITNIAGYLADGDRLHIERRARTTQQIRDLIEQRNPDLLVIDNLNLLHGDTSYGNRVHEISSITAELKVMAGDYNIPIILIAHLNRQCDMREDKRPLLADLRDSGSIEQDANVVMFVYRPGYYDHNVDQRICEIIIAANRSGEVGYINYMADLSTSNFWAQERELGQDGHENAC